MTCAKKETQTVNVVVDRLKCYQGMISPQNCRTKFLPLRKLLAHNSNIKLIIYYVMCLPACETTFALFIVRCNALFGIFALEAQLLQFPLDGQCLRQGYLSTRLN